MAEFLSVTERLWRVRAMSVGPTRDQRYFGARMLQRSAELLPGVPVGWLVRGLELVHPPRDAIAASRVGWVVGAAFVASDGELMATLVIDSERIQRGLERLERAGRLRRQGVSVAFDPDGLAVREHPHWADIMDARRVLGLDFVSRPAMPGACVLEAIRS